MKTTPNFSPPPFIRTPNLIFTTPLLHTTTKHTHFSKLKCTNSINSEEDKRSAPSLKELLSGMVGERVDELLSREENRALLDGLDMATERVEAAKKELEVIERQEVEVRRVREYVEKMEATTAEIEECQKEILEAQAMVKEAERVLSTNGVGDRDLSPREIDEINRNQDRLESVKAASISAIVGTLAGLPVSLAQVSDNSQLILPSGITLISCALFGVTFRYAVRRDLDNIQLKTGTAAAFGFVKGLATLGGGPPLELDVGSFLSHAFNGALYVSENLLIFLFAAVGLDLCIKMGILSPFPSERSDSSTAKTE